MNSESANRFITALVKSLQTLCHGYVDFDDGIEIIGHLYLNIDSGSTFDYVLKEKVCKNAENSTVFLSKSFHAEGKPENLLIPQNQSSDGGQQQAALGDSSMSSPGTTRIQSAITNISNVLSGNTDHNSSQSPLALNAAKRKRDHSGSFNQQNQNLPYKYTQLQSSSASSMSYSFNSPAKQLQPSSNRDSTKHYDGTQPHGEFFGGDSNQSSGMGGEDEEDLHLDVTFVKEEYGERQRAAQLSRSNQDPSSNPNILPENSATSGAYSIGYHAGHNQQFTSAGGTAADMSTSLSQSFQDPSQVDTGQQHHIPPPPNPRNDSSIGPPPRMPQGVKPLCGYVHSEDAKDWMMFELLPESGVYIHQENYNAVMSKTRLDRPDGKAMARYLMSCFWRQSELVGASIADPPKPHQRSLDRGIIQAIIGFCHCNSGECPTIVRRTIQQKIGYAKFYLVKKSNDLDLPKTHIAISAEASPRRMSKEMSKRDAIGVPIKTSSQPKASKRRNRASELDSIPQTYFTHLDRTEDSRMFHHISSPESNHPSGSIPFNYGPRLPNELLYDRHESTSYEESPGMSRIYDVLHPNRPSLPEEATHRIMNDNTPSIGVKRVLSPAPIARMPSEQRTEIATSTSSSRCLSTRNIEFDHSPQSSTNTERMPSVPVERLHGGVKGRPADVGEGDSTCGGNLIDNGRNPRSTSSGTSKGFIDMLNSIYQNN